MANKDRDGAHREIEDLKYRLKNQQMREAVRQDELYRALIQNNNSKPAIIKSNTRIDHDTEQRVFDFPDAPKRRGYNPDAEREQNLDEFTQQSKLVSLSRRGLDFGAAGEENTNDGDDAINQLKYFNDYYDPDNQGIAVTDSLGRYNLPGDDDDFNRLTSLPIADDAATDGVVGILRKNNDRLATLDTMERSHTDRLDKILLGRDEVRARYDAPQDYDMDDELVQEVNHKYGDDYTDALLHKINNPRAYLQ